MTRFVQWVLAGFLLAVNLLAQDVPGQFIVQLAAEPAVSVRAPKRSRADARAAQTSVRSAVQATGATVTDSVDTVMNALIVESADRASLESLPGVARVYPVRMYKMVMDRALQLQKINAAWSLIGGEENAGVGMKIGIIDSGIDVSHPAFRDAGFTMPSGFPLVNKDLDTRYTNNKVIVQRNYDRGVSAVALDRVGHGTAVAMIAAGVRNAAPLSTITGVAPKAWLGAYKVFPDGQEGAPNSNILKAIDDAVNDGMDVINMSLGGFPAERLDADPIAQAVENATRAGVIVVVAAGNDGPGLASVGSPATSPFVITVGASLNDRTFATTATLDGAEPFVALPPSGTRSTERIQGQLADVAQWDPTGLGCSSYPTGVLQGKIALIFRGDCTFEDKLNNAQRAGAVGAIVFARPESPDAIAMSVGTARLPAMMITNANGLDARERLRSNASLNAVLDFNLRPVAINPDKLADFSSKGPGIDNHVKPDLLAVGAAVYTAQPSINGVAQYDTLDGTSFSSPMVAGAAALLKAARPGLRPEQYKSLLANSSTIFRAGGADALPVQQAGAGFLDLSASVRSHVTVVPSSIEFGAASGTVNLSQTIALRNIGSTTETFALTANSLSGASLSISPSSVDIEPGSTTEVTVKLSGTNMPARAYEGFITVRGTQSEFDTRVPFWFAVPDTKPASFTVKPDGFDTARRGTTVEFVVRSEDASGLVLDITPKIMPADGSAARVLSIESLDYRFPGFYLITVRLSTEIGANIFNISVGSVTTKVTINGL